MKIERTTYTERRYSEPVTFDVISAEPTTDGQGRLPQVFIAPGDPTENPLGLPCAVDEATCTREELRAWAQTILDVLATS